MGKDDEKGQLINNIIYKRSSINRRVDRTEEYSQSYFINLIYLFLRVFAYQVLSVRQQGGIGGWGLLIAGRRDGWGIIGLCYPLGLRGIIILIYNMQQEDPHHQSANSKDSQPQQQQKKQQPQNIQQSQSQSSPKEPISKTQDPMHPIPPTSQTKQQKSEKQPQKEDNSKPTQTSVQQSKQQSTSSMQAQLLEMGFEPALVRQAIKVTADKDKAIQYIITCLENEEKMEEKAKQKEKEKEKDKGKNMMMEEEKAIHKPKQEEENEEDFQDFEEEYKMMFLVRMDLKMGLGKIAAQVAHATLKAYKQMVVRGNENDLDFVALEEWKEMGQKKIVVKVNDENELLTTLKKASEKGINTCYIRDAGLTQIASGSITVGALGPAPSSQLDVLTKCFKLL